MRRVALSLVVALAALAGSPLPAQPTLVLRADSLLHEGNPSAALAALDEAVGADRGDAAAWHRRGLLAWELARGRREETTGRDRETRLLRVADSSLRRATRIDPDNPRYLIDLGRFYLSSGFSITRGRSEGLFERALRAARKRKDRASASLALDELGMLAWLRYENTADQNIYSEIVKDPRDREWLEDPRALDFFLENRDKLAASQRMSGERAFALALARFMEAREADADNARALRHSYMALVERQRWEELRHVSRARLQSAQEDASAWLALGLASHRLRDEGVAQAAYDSALRLLPDPERARYSRLTRILTPRDSLGHAMLPPAERERAERLYWLMADPLWLTPGNEHHLEFLSRVAFAELRWSIDEFDVRGADTDRGDMWVRYGPPPAIISFPPDPLIKREHRIRLVWWYPNGVAFLFRLVPQFGIADLDPRDRTRARDLRERIPVQWSNLDVEAHLDTIAYRMARFRGPADSTDVVVMADIPIDSLVQEIDLTRGSLQVELQIFDWRMQRLHRDSSSQVIDFTTRSAQRMRTWRARVPQGTFLYRVEALQPDGMRGARGSGGVEIVAGRGFGASDLLVAAAVAPKPGARTARWSDFNIVPGVGAVQRGRSFGLIWETYELAHEETRSRYRVSISLGRAREGGVAQLAARIIGGVASAIGLASSGEDRITLAYDRTVPASPVTVDYVTMELGSAPPGEYVVSVEITDLITGRRVVRESAITINE